MRTMDSVDEWGNVPTDYGICGCEDNTSLLVGETCDECGEVVREIEQ